MSIYDIDFSKVGPRLTPPDKRYPVMTAWIKALLAPMQWVRDLWFGSYRTGSTANPYVSSTTYSKYDRVIQNTIVYESLINGNTSNPNVATSWMIVQQNFIGLSERLLYTGITLTLTYALNKRFVTIFRQPPNQSDIWISNNVVGVYPFIFGYTEQQSSSFYARTTTEFFINSYSFTGRYNFTINMPLAVYNALDPLPANRLTIVQAFVNRYLPSGITYNVVTY